MTQEDINFIGKTANEFTEEIWNTEHLDCRGNLEIKLQELLKNLILFGVNRSFTEKQKTSIVGFENYIAKVHPDPDSVLIDNLERWKQIVLLAENYANQSAVND